MIILLSTNKHSTLLQVKHKWLLTYFDVGIQYIIIKIGKNSII